MEFGLGEALPIYAGGLGVLMLAGEMSPDQLDGVLGEAR